jgi:hypothetical protein
MDSLRARLSAADQFVGLHGQPVVGDEVHETGHADGRQDADQHKRDHQFNQGKSSDRFHGYPCTPSPPRLSAASR